MIFGDNVLNLPPPSVTYFFNGLIFVWESITVQFNLLSNRLITIVKVNKHFFSYSKQAEIAYQDLTLPFIYKSTRLSAVKDSVIKVENFKIETQKGITC